MIEFSLRCYPRETKNFSLMVYCVLVYVRISVNEVRNQECIFILLYYKVITSLTYFVYLINNYYI
jgi:hypothetical protein